MRFTLSALFLALVAITAPSSTHAVSSHSTLARLSARLAAAESTLAQLSSSSHVDVDAEPSASLIGTYSFESGLADTNGQNPIAKEPAIASNINVVAAPARFGSVLSRANSVAQGDTYAFISRAIPAGPFSVSLFINWAGIYNAAATGSPATTEGVFAATDNDKFKIAVHGAGTVTAYAGGQSIDIGTVTANKWYQVTVSVLSTNKIRAYLNGVLVGDSVTAGTAFPGSSRLILLNAAARGSGLIGAIDQVYVYSGVLADPEPQFLYSDNVPASGFSAPIDETSPTRYWGHYDINAVRFANTIQSGATGAITIAGRYLDCDFRDVNQVWVKMAGVTGTTKAATLIPGVGTVSWDAATSILTFRPVAGMATIPSGTNWSFTIPGSALNLNNPAQGMLALSSDVRWIMSPMNLDLDQTKQTTGRKQGVRWQSVIETPFTIDPNPAL